MHLTYRLAAVADLDFCDWHNLEGFDDAPHLRACVPQIWRRFLLSGGLTIMLVEDEDRAAGQRIVWHGGSLFVWPDTMAHIRQSATPGLTGRIVAAALDGHALGLTTAEVRRANSGDGLHLLGLHYALHPGLEEQQAWLVRAKAIEAYHAAFEGYQLQEILIEAHGAERRRVMVAGGFRARADYGSGSGGREASLMGVTRAEAVADGGGSVIASLFAYSPPRFGFKPGEQEMLCHALTGETDDHLAQQLCVSPSTIKTRWRMVYERVQSISPSLLPETLTEQPHRGLEKRRRLLAYLRHHPEEVRPCL